MGRLAGKHAVVLGASAKGNIGQAIARRFAAEGCQVLVAGRQREPLRHFAEEIGAVWQICDITDRLSVKALADIALEKLGGVDIAVQSVGWGYLKPFLENTDEELRRITELQYIGPIRFFQAMIGTMTNGGSIITLSSVTAQVIVNDHAAYQGTKAGIDQVVRCLAAEFGPRKIRINSLSPGLTETPMTAGMKRERFTQVAMRNPLRRLGTPEDIAAAAVWLASDECFMTGQSLQVNGGLSLTGVPVEGR